MITGEVLSGHTPPRLSCEAPVVGSLGTEPSPSPSPWPRAGPEGELHYHLEDSRGDAGMENGEMEAGGQGSRTAPWWPSSEKYPGRLIQPKAAGRAHCGLPATAVTHCLVACSCLGPLCTENPRAMARQLGPSPSHLADSARRTGAPSLPCQ